MSRYVKSATVVAFTLCVSLLSSGCTVRISESQFIAHDEKASPYTDEYVQQLEQAMPNSTVSKVSIDASENAQLNGLYIDNPNSQTALMFFQGNGMKVEPHSLSVLTRLAELNTDILIMDRRGLGASEGSPRIDNLVKDAQLQLDYLHQHYQPQKVIIHGYSLGSFIAGQLAKSNKIDALVMHGSATNVDDWIDEKTPWYMPFMNLEITGDFRSVDNKQVVATAYNGPLLVIAGEDDEEVPAVLAEKLFAASQSSVKELIMVSNAKHTGMLDNADALNKYKEFVAAL